MTEQIDQRCAYEYLVFAPSLPLPLSPCLSVLCRCLSARGPAVRFSLLPFSVVPWVASRRTCEGSSKNTTREREDTQHTKDPCPWSLDASYPNIPNWDRVSFLGTPPVPCFFLPTFPQRTNRKTHSPYECSSFLFLFLSCLFSLFCFPLWTVDDDGASLAWRPLALFGRAPNAPRIVCARKC
jgi:hypothetical protein